MADTNYKEQIFQLIAKVNEKNPYYTIIGFLAILLILDYFCVMQFQLKTLRALSPKANTLAEELKTAKGNIQRIPQYQTEITEMNEKDKK